jgi:hypothetical protein
MPGAGTPKLAARCATLPGAGGPDPGGQAGTGSDGNPVPDGTFRAVEPGGHGVASTAVHRAAALLVTGGDLVPLTRRRARRAGISRRIGRSSLPSG